MLLEIDGTRYPMVGVDDATLADLIAIKRQTGIGIAELQEVTERFEGLDETEIEAAAEADPDGALLVMGVSVWLTRRAAGETHLTLEEACAVPMDRIRQIPEPGDRKASKKAAKKAAQPDPS